MIQLEQYHEGKVIYGITHANKGSFTQVGFTISATDVCTPNEVESCRRELAELLNFPYPNAQFQKQVHGVTIVGRPAIDSHHCNESDGMFTTQLDTLLCVSVADCCGVLIWSDDHQLIAGVHSGWKGTQQNIAGKCIDILQQTYNYKPESLNVWLSPCASGKAYVVKQDVQQYFSQFCTAINNTDFLFDNKAAIVAQLTQKGVPTSKIRVSDECTILNHSYHSYRRDGALSGRMAAFIGIRS
ncbi:MAG: polyphenol oxidase family protein [Candidatus Kapaibacterium sp.]